MLPTCFPSLPRNVVPRICYIPVRLVHPIFERLVPAKSNQGRNDQEFNQQSLSLHVQDCQKERSIQSAAQGRRMSLSERAWRIFCLVFSSRQATKALAQD